MWNLVSRWSPPYCKVTLFYAVRVQNVRSSQIRSTLAVMSNNWICSTVAVSQTKSNYFRNVSTGQSRHEDVGHAHYIDEMYVL